MIGLPERPASWEREVDVAEAIAAAGSDAPVIVVDEEAAPPHGALVISPAGMTDERMALFLRHTTGVIRVAASEARLHALGLGAPEASIALRDGPPPASARGRAATIRALGDPATPVDSFTRPGHVLLVQAREPGVLLRPALPEAALDLVRLAGGGHAATFCEISHGGELADPAAVQALAAELGIPSVAVADLVRYQIERHGLVERMIETTLPTRAGSFRCVAYRCVVDDTEHLALVTGDISGDEPVLARVQRSFPLDELLGRSPQPSGGVSSQLERSMARMAREGRGVLVYLRPYPDIGVGLVSELQDRAARIEAQASHPYLGYDERQHGIGAQILRDLGLHRLRLLTDHPRRHRGLSGFGLEVVEYVPLTQGGS